MTARFLALYETPADPEAFDRHYRETHIPLIRGLPGLRRYTIGRDVKALHGAPYYLVAELECGTPWTICRPHSPQPRAAPPPPMPHACRSLPRYAG